MEKGIFFNIGGSQYHLHDSVFNIVLVAIALLILGLFVKRAVKKADYKKKPTGLLHIMEIYIEAISSLVDQTMGKGMRGFVPYMGTLLILLISSNLLGLIGLTPPTSDYNVTAGLAMITFFMIHFFGIKSKVIGEYVKGYFEPMPFLFPINFIGEIATPISLSFRLFGNILSGMIIMELVHSALSKISVALVPISAVLHAYFDVFSGLLQAFVFTMLTMVYVGLAFPEQD